MGVDADRARKPTRGAAAAAVAAAQAQPRVKDEPTDAHAAAAQSQSQPSGNGEGDAVDLSRYDELLRRYTEPYDAACTELAEVGRCRLTPGWPRCGVSAEATSKICLETLLTFSTSAGTPRV